MSKVCEVGDRGQRYEVRCKKGGGEVVFGWTDREDGQPFVRAIELHPVWHSPKVVDRQKKEEPEK